LMVMMRPIQRILLEVLQGLVHPPHVPLEGESEAAFVRRLCHIRPRRRFLRHREAAGRLVTNCLIELLEELDRLEVLASAETVAHPLARFAAVVEIQHGCYGVDAQPVGVKLLEPEERIRYEEIPNLVSPV